MKRVVIIIGCVIAALGLILTIAVFVLASRFEGKIAAPNTPYPQIKASTDPEVIKRGEYLVRAIGHCGQCHGDYQRLKPEGNKPDMALSGGFEFDMPPIGKLYSANLSSDPETGIGRRSDAELARTIRAGVLPDGQISVFMRYGTAKFSDEDLTAAISYLRTLPPVKKAVPRPEIGTIGKALFSLLTLSPNMEPAPKHVPPAGEPSVERGEYLAEHVVGCVPCHSHVDMSTFMPVGPKAGGGDPGPSPDKSGKEFVPPNLTSHPTGITGRLSEDAFVARIRAGRAYAASIMPWEDFGRASESDLRSIYRYLKKLPPVDNDVGPTYR
jgi:mono/diheme cytochrome c family protein